MELLGLFTLTVMFICYAFLERSHWFTLTFVGALVLGLVYAFIKHLWPLALVDAVGTLVMLRRWELIDKSQTEPLPKSKFN